MSDSRRSPSPYRRSPTRIPGSSDAADKPSNLSEESSVYRTRGISGFTPSTCTSSGYQVSLPKTSDLESSYWKKFKRNKTHEISKPSMSYVSDVMMKSRSENVRPTRRGNESEHSSNLARSMADTTEHSSLEYFKNSYDTSETDYRSRRKRISSDYDGNNVSNFLYHVFYTYCILCILYLILYFINIV